LFSDLQLRFEKPTHSAAIPRPAVEARKGNVCAGTHAGRSVPTVLAHQPKDIIVCYTIMVIMFSSTLTQMLFRLLTPVLLQFTITKEPLKIKRFCREGEKREYCIFPKKQNSIRFAVRNRKTLFFFYIMILLLGYLEGTINRRKFLFCDSFTIWNNFFLM